MSVFKRGDSFWYEFVVRGVRYRGSIGKVRRKAASEVAEKKRIEALEGKLLERPLKAPLLGQYNAATSAFSDAAGEYLAYYQKNHKASSYRRMTMAMRPLCGFFGIKRLDQIDAFSIERYKGQRKDAGMADATVNRELACLKNLFNMGRRWGWVRENPVRDVKLFRESNARERWLDLEEEAALLRRCQLPLSPLVLTALLNHCPAVLKPFVLGGLAKRCNPKLRTFVLAAADTGFRAAELQSLRWQDVDFERGNITVASGYAKNGATRTNPISKRLMEALRDWKAASGGNGDGSAPVFGAYRYREPFERVRKAAELGEDVLFHSLRHTFISRLVMGGVDLRTVQELAGHKTIAITMRYAHLAPETKKRAVGVLDRVLGNQVPTKSPTFVLVPAAQVAQSVAA